MRHILLILILCCSIGAFAKKCPTVQGYSSRTGARVQVSYPQNKGKTLGDYCLRMDGNDAKGKPTYLLSNQEGAGSACGAINVWAKETAKKLRQQGYDVVTQVPAGEYAVASSAVCARFDGSEGSCPSLAFGENAYVWLRQETGSKAHRLMQEDQKNRGYHVLLSDGTAYHYEQDRQSVPLCQ